MGFLNTVILGAGGFGCSLSVHPNMPATISVSITMNSPSIKPPWGSMREYAYDAHSPLGKLSKALDETKARGWAIVDMKRDWDTIFPP